MKSRLVSIMLVAALTLLITIQPALAEKFSFGVMSDTQWSKNTPDNPGTVAVGIINQLNAQFIEKDVKFVLQVGDLDDKETNYSGLPSTPRLGISTRAAATQALYDAGIGFFPVRGNHEGSATAASEVQSYFPQTQGQGANVVGATNFSSPSTNLNGLSYAFNYGNATFMLIDQFTPTDGKASDGSTYSQGNNAVASQQSWISSTLAAKQDDSHAFVFSHKQLFGGNHSDTLFGSAASNASAQDAFIKTMDDSNVGYVFTGHDHMHNQSVVTSPDGTSKVNQVICASDSYKFYTPVSLANHGTDTTGPNAGQIAKNREAEISQELYSTGYYIVEVDGPRVTVDFYSADPNPLTPGLEDLDLLTTPNLTFSKRESFGYSLNGKQFLVAGGGNLSVVQDAYGDTSMSLDGINNCVLTDYNGRVLNKNISTGWTDQQAGQLSDALTLWGIDGLNGDMNPFELTMSYIADAGYMGPITLARMNDDGSLTNLGGSLNGDGTISAMVDTEGTFVVVPEPMTLSLLALGCLSIIRRRK